MADKKDNNPKRDIDRELEELVVPASKGKLKNSEVVKSKLTELQVSLDALRLGLKYLIFDLEATRRENDDLRKKLEDRNKPK